MIIKNNSGTVQSEAGVLKTYFGMHPGQTLTGFMGEIKALTPESKNELVRGAAKELGHTIEE